MDKNLKLAPLALFCIYFGKALVTTPTFVDAAILTILAGAACFYQFKSSENKFDGIQKQFAEQQKRISEFENHYQTHTSREINDLKSQVGSIKLGQTYGTFGKAK